jgi:threonine/homoserine efflux transporter RhtA
LQVVAAEQGVAHALDELDFQSWSGERRLRDLPERDADGGPEAGVPAVEVAEEVAACVGFTAIALARGELAAPHGWTVWSALLVTGVFASALAFLFQSWAQRRLDATRTALVFSLEPVFAGIFGYAVAGDRLGALGWGGCVVILAGIVVAEPFAADVLRRLIPGPG